MGLIHKPKQAVNLREQFSVPISSYRDLYRHYRYPYHHTIHVESHMYFYRPVISQLHAVQDQKKWEDVQSMESNLR
jgi:hypothetical protein